MSKKLIAACMAIAAFAAFAMASTASAAPILTSPTGSVAAAGTGITGTNVGDVIMTTSFGSVTCDKAVLSGVVTNSATASGTKGEVTAATFQGTGTTASNGDKECTSWTGGATVTPGLAGGLPWCLEATSSTDEAKIRGGKCSELARGIKFGLDFTSIGTCVYNRSAAAVGTLQTDVGGQDAMVSIAQQEWTKTEGGALCPGTGLLDMTFTLETSSGSPVYFSS